MHKISHLITTESAALVEGLTEIDEQLGQDSEELAASIDQMAALLRQTLLSENGDVLHAASRVLGHLARAGGSLATECVELELRRSSGPRQSGVNPRRAVDLVVDVRGVAK